MASYPSIINAIPDGFLSLLQLKQTGRNPSSMAEFIQPTVDFTDWYAAATAEIVSSTTTIRSAVGIAVTDLVVPQNETWLVAAATCSVAPAAGVTAARCQVAVQNTNAAGTFLIYASPTVAVPGGSAAWLPLVDRPIILRPNDTFVLNAIEYAGVGNITLQAMARIARLLI
jgi:hypothetical protein